MLRRLFSDWSFSRRSPSHTARAPRFWLGCEHLESREVLSVTLKSITEPQIPNNEPMYVPVSVTNIPAGAVTTAVTSDNPGITASVVQGGQSVRFDVTGTDSNGVPFSGSITIRLFTDSAPDLAQRVIDLVNSGFYVGKNFPRVLNNFMIQGGGSSTSDNSPLPALSDQFNAGYTFDSGGIVAMANSGNDTNNSQFFITDPKVALTQRPQYLNYRYSIVGILTSGFDIYQKIITTTVTSTSSGENSKPTNPITITGATVFNDTTNAVIKLTPNNNFTGTANITITANDGTGPTTQTFSTTGIVVNASNAGSNAPTNPPFLGPVQNQTTTAGQPVSFTVPYTNVNGTPVAFAVKNDSFSGAPSNVTVSINQQTGVITLTPAAGFTGTIQLKVGVRLASASDSAGNYDTQLFTLTVDPATATSPPPPSNTGPFTAQGSAAGSAARVTILNSDGSVRFSIPVFDPSFTGGVQVEVGDVTGDGTNDVVAVPELGGGPIILVIDATTGSIVRTVTVFDPTFRGGLHLKLGDASGRGYDQVLVAAGETGGPRVTLLDLVHNQQLLNFFIGDPNARGGVSVDLATVFSNQGMMIVGGTGPGSSPTVYVYNASTGAVVGNFAAGSPSDTGGIRVRVGTMNTSTGAAPIFAAPLYAPPGTSETSYDPAQLIKLPK